MQWTLDGAQAIGVFEKLPQVILRQLGLGTADLLQPLHFIRNEGPERAER